MDRLTDEEQIIFDAIVAARDVQEFIWDKQSLQHHEYAEKKDIWIEVFQKRVDKIGEINFEHPSALIELRKRVLQQAALSIAALKVLKNG